MFENLTKKLSEALNHLRGKTTITDNDVKETIVDIENALLDADVSLSVVKSLTEKISNNAIGQNVVKSISPDKMIIKIVYDTIADVLTDNNIAPIVLDKKLKKIMLVGLQGSGKTTTSAKLVKYLTKNDKSLKSYLTSVDVYRPAAVEQLKILSQQVGAKFTEVDPNKDKPIDILKRAKEEIATSPSNLWILDTAGRNHTDLKMMQELQEIESIFQPDEIFLVVDSMTGQDAINIAREFHNCIHLSGIIISRIDGDPRGGVALSMRSLTNLPIRFLGTGEKIDQIEQFDPKRIAGRILDMGDIVSFVEQAQAAQEEDDERITQRMQNGFFDLNDFSHHFKKIQKMGGLTKILKFLPGLSNLTSLPQAQGLDESFIKKNLAIISSMTKQERKNHTLIKSSRKLRIAAGSGTTVQEINKLLKQFEQMQLMVKKMKNMPLESIKNMFGK